MFFHSIINCYWKAKWFKYILWYYYSIHHILKYETAYLTGLLFCIIIISCNISNHSGTNTRLVTYFLLNYLKIFSCILILLIKYNLLFKILVGPLEILTYSIYLLAICLFLGLNKVFTVSLFINIRKSSED